MAKNNQKCIRVSDGILNIIEKVQGNSFNEKLENLVILYEKSIPEREERLMYLDNRIEFSRMELGALTEEIKKSRKLIDNYLKGLAGYLENENDIALELKKTEDRVILKQGYKYGKRGYMT